MTWAIVLSCGRGRAVPGECEPHAGLPHVVVRKSPAQTMTHFYS